MCGWGTKARSQAFAGSNLSLLQRLPALMNELGSYWLHHDERQK